MCGIAGYYGKKTIHSGAIDNCMARMKRRGPDAEGLYHHTENSGNHVYLLHSRLSIIDLDKRANQPFKYKSLVLVNNGELYNYIELKNELGNLGYRFKTKSDTEVLNMALDAYGYGGLDKCEGMWAFALYDENKGGISLCRDRFGEKPLYYYEDDSGVYFGSEVKFLSALSGVNFDINDQHIYRYLVNGYKSLYKVEEQFFKGVKEVPGSCLFVVKPDGTKKTIRYWEPKYLPDDTLSYADSVEMAREALVESVRLRLRSDVPLAFCMSGGVDSNALISIAKRKFNYNVHGFTIVSADERYEEKPLVDVAVDDLDIKHSYVDLDSRNFIPKLEKLVKYHDSPVYTITYFAHWLLMECVARKGYRISISGTAADELFTGYYDHHSMYLREVSNDNSLFKESLENWEKHIQPIVRNPLLQNPMAFIENPDQRDHIYLNADIFSSYLYSEFSEGFCESEYCHALLRNRMLNELFHESVPVILHEDDLNAMYFSIENRSPFLDRKLFEACNKIPTRFLIRDGCAKKVLRDSMEGIVPDAVLESRRKVGFNAPIFSFLDLNDGEVRNYLLDDSPIYNHVKKDKIETLLKKAFLPNSESKFLFNFICAKMFFENYG